MGKALEKGEAYLAKELARVEKMLAGAAMSAHKVRLRALRAAPAPALPCPARCPSPCPGLLPCVVPTLPTLSLSYSLGAPALAGEGPRRRGLQWALRWVAGQAAKLRAARVLAGQAGSVSCSFAAGWRNGGRRQVGSRNGRADLCCPAAAAWPPRRWICSAARPAC